MNKNTVRVIADATFAAQRDNRSSFASCISQELALGLTEDLGWKLNGRKLKLTKLEEFDACLSCYSLFCHQPFGSET